MAVTGAGLEGVVATDSRFALSTGMRESSAIRATDIDTLAENATFEEVIYPAVERPAAQAGGTGCVEGRAGGEPRIPAPVEAFLEGVAKARDRWMCCAPRFPCCRFTIRWQGQFARSEWEEAVKLMSQTATIVTSFDRLRNGKKVVAGDPKLGFAANFLYTLTGKKPDKVMEQDLRHRANAACGARTERLDFRGARDGGDAIRHLFGDRPPASAR